MTEEQFYQITEWQDKTFPKATSLSKLYHLEQEIKELKESITNINHGNTWLEFADCFLLLYGAAGKYGLSFEDIHHAIAEKFEINKKRNWGTPDENGVVNHVK